MDLDVGDVMIRMINNSNNTLEDVLKTYKDQEKTKTQEVEARTRRHIQS